ncbi:MAG TPA: DUF4272 domain-containing protein [Phycisphaerales bacterium]|nr:DUF4272 domain-containing protein [Phycisphaerales bacterium]
MAKQPAAKKIPEERKAASIALLSEKGVPVLESLPTIESEDEAGQRSEDELRAQILALSMVWLRAHFAATGRPHKEFLRAFEPLRADAEEALGDTQLAFIDDPRPSDEDTTDALWTIEAIAALLWAGGLLKKLDWPTTPADPAALEPLIEAAIGGEKLHLRSTSDLLDQADLYYRLLWAVVQKQVDGPASPINGSIVYERARAFGWLTQPEVEWERVDMTT